MKKVNVQYTNIETPAYLDGVGFEALKELLHDLVYEEVGDETPHGECGDEEPVKYFLYKGKFYEVAIQIDWNRYDKRFYYMDGSQLVSCKEISPLKLLMKGEV